MKTFLLLLVVLGIAYYIYAYTGRSQQGQSGAGAAKPSVAAAPSAAPQHGFKEVIALLTQDMNNIPETLDSAARPPANAFTIKRKVQPYLDVHPEYQVLTNVCELIIEANTQRDVIRQSCHSEQTLASFDGPLTHDTSMDHAYPASNLGRGGQAKTNEAARRTAAQAIQQRAQSSWSAYRAQTSSEVQRLLGTLAAKQL